MPGLFTVEKNTFFSSIKCQVFSGNANGSGKGCLTFRETLTVCTLLIIALPAPCLPDWQWGNPGLLPVTCKARPSPAIAVVPCLILVAGSHPCTLGPFTGTGSREGWWNGLKWLVEPFLLRHSGSWRAGRDGRIAGLATCTDPRYISPSWEEHELEKCWATPWKTWVLAWILPLASS